MSNYLSSKLNALFGDVVSEFLAILNRITTRINLKRYTATFSSLTNATAATFWMRDGQFLEIHGQVRWTGAGGAGAFTVALPTEGSPVIDTDNLPGGTGTANGEASMCGDLGFWFDSGAGWLFVGPVFVTTTTVGFIMNGQILDGSQFANGDALNFKIRVPIVGWR